ncbi:HAMP domain-containing sensor histidine kinase [Tissierella sp. Yu-01]|uniref:sensor histidine kinase n=1 Tax=Tissierella sp. Yu-01 TaxID=3035694 RepID=UPI00240D84E3|nr:HAMP domain-containing sensor histidine kinase [Tissierella sp. Yu-01]WFA09335.1 HAMP domain-containing sensor histidine kinase [Tissierella sp. Yu-01]
MDTKLKNVSRNTITKLIAFILTVILISTAITLLLYVDIKGYNPETIIVSEYKDSSTGFSQDVSDAFHRTYWLMRDRELGNEGEITLPENINYFFYITDGETILTNREDYSREQFAKYKESFFAYEKGRMAYGEDTNPNIITWFDTEEDVTIYVAFPDEYMEKQQETWVAERNILIPIAKVLVISIAVALISIIHLIIVTGRKPEDDELHTNWVDRIYTEILLIAYIPPGLLWIITISWVIHYSNYYTTYNNMSLYIIGIVTAIAAALCGIILLALVRKFKDKRFIRDSLLYKTFYRITDLIKSLFDGRRFAKYPLTKSLHQRQVIFIGASFILVFLTFLFIMIPPMMILPPILEVAIIYWYLKYNNETYDEINKGFNESLEEQMKSERMKVELITNVSHDLKTPLTSIISYVDLLSKEEDLSETAKDYVNILAEKSNRLKNIVSDLFDLAKSTSGNINLDFETIDMKKLIEQTLGDMEDNIEKSGLQIKTILPDNPINIKSDGKKLYRVFQNVIDNALKYSLEGTRIFIELEEIDSRAVATIKNIAGYEMNFTSDEILQRFNRGDKSRTSDGSGLGLSIAESFTNVCGGIFKIDIDGDMFKVIMSFDLV